METKINLLAICTILLAFWLPSQAYATNCIYPLRNLTTLNPVPVRSNQLIAPQIDGSIQIANNAQLQLYCPTTFQHFADQTLINVRCSQTNKFQLTDSQYQCSAGKAAKNPVTIVSNANPISVYSLGYNINNVHVSKLQSTTNATGKRPQFVHHVVQPIEEASRQVSTSNYFAVDPIFTTADIKRFDYAKQRKAICINTLHLSDAQCDEYFNESTAFLARGHLAPAADFPYLLERQATYKLLNVAPQWQQLNNGRWRSVEMGVRAQSRSLGRPLDVYTGTLGTMQMKDVHNHKRNVYLDVANKTMAVPLLFYKVVLDKVGGQGVVFVAVNNPYATPEIVRIAKRMVGCEDVADQLQWPGALYNGRKHIDRLTSEFRANGYLFACKVQDFAAHNADMQRVVGDTVYTLLGPHEKR